MNALILGLDISSSSIGYCIRNTTVISRGVIRLDAKAAIGARCMAAHDALEKLLDQHAVDLVAVESPVARYAKAIIPQCRMSGVMLELAERRGVLACEIAPKEAKRALVGNGNASKEQMLFAAAGYFGYNRVGLHYAKRRGEWCAYKPPLFSGLVAYSEHEADALGVAVAAERKVQVVT